MPLPAPAFITARYLIISLIDASGQAFYPQWTNHFDPSSLIFDARHRNDVLLSDAALLVVIAGLTVIFRPYGFGTMMKFYGAWIQGGQRSKGSC